MTTYLLATDSVHATAAGCDYLGGRLDPGDSVLALAVVEDGGNAVGGEEARDVADALNVAEVRLSGAVETERREGDPADAILAAAAEHAVDEIVLVDDESGAGSTIEAVREGADRPVRVVSPP
ncbi:MAG: universal stress protein [Halobacteriales archaeon]